MKTKVLSLVMLLTLAFTLSVSAVVRWDDGANCTPVLSFSRQTATCSVSIKATDTKAKITANMTLIQVSPTGLSIPVNAWGGLSGTGRLDVSKTQTNCNSGSLYVLAVSGTITDSTGNTPISASKQVRCP